MKQALRSGLFLLAAMVLPACGNAAPEIYTEGTHYKTTAERMPTSNEEGKIEVLEVFSYACPHCFHLESPVKAWLENKPDNATFVRLPAIFRDSWLPLAEIFYAAAVLDVQDKLHTALFKAIHEDKREFKSYVEYLDFIEEQAVDRAAFEKAMNSFTVKGQVRKALVYSRTSGITGVPAIIVNGQYIVSAASAGGKEEMFNVVDFLVNKIAAAQ